MDAFLSNKIYTVTMMKQKQGLMTHKCQGESDKTSSLILVKMVFHANAIPEIY